MADHPSDPAASSATSATEITPLPIRAASLVPGDIVWVNIPTSHTVGSEQQKRRPWLVVSTERFNKGPLGLVIAVPLSKQIPPRLDTPSRVLLDVNHVTYQDKGLQDDLKLERVRRTALCDQVRALSEKRLLAKAGKAQGRVLDDVRAGLAFNLDL